jgi:hypothetical protein
MTQEGLEVRSLLFAARDVPTVHVGKWWQQGNRWRRKWIVLSTDFAVRLCRNKSGTIHELTRIDTKYH